MTLAQLAQDAKNNPAQLAKGIEDAEDLVQHLTKRYAPLPISCTTHHYWRRLPCTTAAMLTMTATVKAMDSQRWVCRTHLFQFKVTSSEDEPEADRARLQALRNRLR
jgi:hypothetical protein